jgi:hypothetical protein
VIFLTLPPSPSLKHKGRREMPQYVSNTPLPLNLKEGVGDGLRREKGRGKKSGREDIAT